MFLINPCPDTTPQDLRASGITVEARTHIQGGCILS